MCCQVREACEESAAQRTPYGVGSRDPDIARHVFKRQPLLGFVLDTVVLPI